MTKLSTDCAVCRVRSLDPGATELSPAECAYILGLVDGIEMVVRGTLPSLCEEHRKHFHHACEERGIEWKRVRRGAPVVTH